METPTPKFKIGEIVCKPAFVDCFGKLEPRVEMLRVIELNLSNANSEGGVAPYWRIKATPDAHGLAWFEASERFFEKLGS